MIEEQVAKWFDNPSNYYKIEKAKKEGWFGSLHSNRDHKGLLGYLRLNFGKQIKILNRFLAIWIRLVKRLRNFLHFHLIPGIISFRNCL